MYFKDGEATTDVGLVEHYAAIEAARTQQRGIEHVGAVRGSNDDNICILIKAIHLNEQLVQGLLTLVVATGTRVSTLTTNRVNLVDEDDTGCVLLRFLKEVSHAGRTNTYKHFYKFGTTDTVERDACFTSYGAGDQRFTGSWRANEQYAFGSTCPHSGETLGMLKELNDLLKFQLGLFHSSHIFKEDRGVRFI